MTAFALLDHTSVFVFALTGALVASRAQLDIVGFIFLGTLTAVGGGTIRDLLLNREAVFWIASPSYVGVATAASILIYFTAPMLESRKTWIVWLDAVALSVAVSVGFGVALDHGHGLFVVAMMTMITGTMGGLMRDVVANEVPLLLNQGEIYATACLAGAACGIGMLALGGTLGMAMFVAAATAFVLRAGSIAFGWRLPLYKPRPPRN
ncbi:trimeric intracellular cation channel family protein [Pseudoruegeria sp. SHC-113]|uniref:trimeric intracellular cation channel family protein n=1 Tax=Pseudoruegeria sp. SHC-113 TaxID=2855439 RepID=UPI0021BB49A3|nr:trimeric intracellular cation channel family protein [Pseudoruegeria sp. SHC-113]MCT8159221.1 trimeric intracellular cation channel family protein [Pseudoruegeria sp. SHC-113]